MKYKPYPKYKDSGVEWLGEIPERWDFAPLKRYYELQDRPVTDDDEIVTAFRDGTVTLRRNRREDGFTNALKEIGYQGVRKGDLVIHAMDAFAGAIGVSDSDGKSTPVYSVCKVRDLNLSYASYHGYLLRSMAVSGYIAALAKGIRERSTDFRWAEAGQTIVPLPPLPTQRAIATFLNTETARIDGLIKDYEELIELLKEKRQALISHAVTRGLSELVSPDDPEFGEWAKPVKFKDSGVEWIGEIPEGWILSTVRYCFAIGRGRVISQEELIEDGLFPVFSSQTLNKGCLGYINTYDFDCEQITWTTDGANAGTVFIRLGKHNCTNVCGTLQVKRSDLILRYYYYLLSIGTEYYKRPDTNGAKIMNNEMAVIKIVIPPMIIQQAIAIYLDKKTVKMETLINEAESAIELLKEHRSALITNAVTGKINVEKIV